MSNKMRTIRKLKKDGQQKWRQFPLKPVNSKKCNLRHFQSKFFNGSLKFFLIPNLLTLKRFIDKGMSRMDQPRNDENNRSEAFSNGSIPSMLKKIAIPGVISQILLLLYNMVDRIYLGRLNDGGTACVSLLFCFHFLPIGPCGNRFFPIGESYPEIILPILFQIAYDYLFLQVFDPDLFFPCVFKLGIT